MRKRVMLTKSLIFSSFFLILAGEIFAVQNPLFKDNNVIFEYIDAPRHYSLRANIVQIRLINESINFKATYDMVRISPNTFQIVIPRQFFFRYSGITKYEYFYYFIVNENTKVLDPTNREKTKTCDEGVNGRASYFTITQEIQRPFLITKNPEVVSTGLIFYYTKPSNTLIKLLITDGKRWSLTLDMIKKTHNIPYVFIPVKALPDKKLFGKYLYKYIVNGKYELDPLNPNQENSVLRGIFNVVEIKDPADVAGQIPENPVIKMEGLYFYCKAPGARSVGLLTNINNWRTILPMSKSLNPSLKEIWVIVLSKANNDIPLVKGKYKYKFVIDGIVTHDRNNPNLEEDGIGSKVSIFTLSESINHYGKNPIHISGHIYRFFFMSRSAKRVFLAGNFNNWNPFNLRMKRVNADTFVIDIVLHPDTYYYYFVVDNRIFNDKTSTDVLYNQTGQKCNVIKIETITAPIR